MGRVLMSWDNGPSQASPTSCKLAPKTGTDRRQQSVNMQWPLLK